MPLPADAGPVLALEASTRRPGAALLGPGGEPQGRWMPHEATLGTAALAAAVAGLLEEAGYSVADLAGVGVGTGPGSYTGLRSAIALARGMAFAAGRPLAGVASVQAAALAALRADPAAAAVVVLVDARRGQLYRADYRQDDGRVLEVAPPRLVPADAPLPDDVLVVREPVPDAYDVALLARARLAAGGDDPAAVRPLYLKRSHAEMAVDERGGTRTQEGGA